MSGMVGEVMTDNGPVRLSGRDLYDYIREHGEMFVRYVACESKAATCRSCGAPRKERHGTTACHYCGVVR